MEWKESAAAAGNVTLRATACVRQPPRNTLPLPFTPPPTDLKQNRVGLHFQRQHISFRLGKLKVMPMEQQQTSKSSTGISWKIAVEFHENFYSTLQSPLKALP